MIQVKSKFLRCYAGCLPAGQSRVEGINGARLEATRSKAFLTLSNERSGPLICGIGRGGDLRLAIQALVRSMNVRSSSFFTERQNIRFAWVLVKSASHIDRQLFYLGHSVSPGETPQV